MKFDPTAKIVKKAKRGKDKFTLTECKGYNLFNLWLMVPAPSAAERQAWEDQGIADIMEDCSGPQFCGHVNDPDNIEMAIDAHLEEMHFLMQGI